MSEGATRVRHGANARGKPVGSTEVAYLLVVEGPSRGTLAELREGSYVIGRGITADVRVDDESVSREHVKLVKGGDGIVNLIDLNATNGTFVNRSRVDVTVLREDDRIQLGPDTVIRFTYYPPEGVTKEKPAEAAPVDSSVIKLSPRQLEIARLVAEGLSNAQIGKLLHISPRTVSTHLEHIYDRLDINSRVELVRQVSEAGLLEETLPKSRG